MPTQFGHCDLPSMLDATIVFMERGFLATENHLGTVEKLEEPDIFHDPLETLEFYEHQHIVL